MSERKATVKSRNWCAVIYPESLPEDYMARLQATGVRIAISPLHDKDLDEDNSGNLKKPHYHMIYQFDGPTTYNVVKRIQDDLGQPAPQKLESSTGYYRYFTHKDNPDKASYEDKIDDIVHLNGSTFLDFDQMSKGDVLNIKRELCEIIEEHDFVEFNQIQLHAMWSLTDKHFDVLLSNSNTFNIILRSRRYGEHRNRNRNTVDVTTGEIK